ncbi:MAG: DUF4173 domain-containing protein [Flavobacteriales bacterium]|nr:DUF4173 domain-containing protein [Flavobacteriales bacterium]
MSAQQNTTFRIATITTFLAAVIFDQLFWDQDIGINLPVFSVLIIALLVADLGWSGFSRSTRVATFGVLISAFSMAWQGSIIATIAVCSTLVVCSAFAHAPSLRAVTFATVQWMSNVVSTPLGLFASVGNVLPDNTGFRKGWRSGRLVFLPLLVLAVFFLLYKGGNSKFDAMTAGFLDTIGEYFSRLFTEVFTPHTLFFLFGLVLTASLLIRYAGNRLIHAEGAMADTLKRMRVKRAHWLPPLAMGALDRERRMAVVLLVLVNALLLVVNAIDIQWVWFGFMVEPGMSLKEFVHEGTWLLIISILLSMAILFYQFRGNMNFHPKNRTLILLASAWLVQNFILGVSVFLRNYHYISFHGLAYKRIGVIVFLVLMLVGLVTLFIKIRERKSFFYLVRVNGWAAFAMLVSLGTVDWDSTIVRYNLHHWNQGEIDVDNYLAMSDKVLPLLYADMDRVREQMSKHQENATRWVTRLDPNTFSADLNGRKADFLEQYRTQDWQSWTFADRRTYLALTKDHETPD